MKKSILLSEKHIALAESSTVKEICLPFFNKTDIQYFHYARVKDNKVSLLVSQADWNHYYWKNAGKFVVKNEAYCANLLKEAPKGLSFSLKESMAAKHAREYFGLVDFVQWFSQIDGGYEEFAFATYKGHASIDFCINNQDLLYKFGLYFKEKAADLIQKSSSQEIDFSNLTVGLPSKISTDFKFEIPLQHYHVIHNHKSYVFHTQEFEILKLLVYGYSYKAIGNQLNISEKLVADCLSNIKNKLGIHSQQKLIQTFYENSSFHSFL